MECRSHFLGKTAWQGLLKVQPKPVKEEGAWHGGHQSLGNILVPPLPPLLSSLSSGAPSSPQTTYQSGLDYMAATRFSFHCSSNLASPDAWFPLNALPVFLSPGKEAWRQLVWPHFWPLPTPHPPPPSQPHPASGQNNSLPLNIHLPGVQAPGPGILGQVAQQTPFPASHDPLGLNLFLFFLPRGIVRATQRRTLRRGKPSTLGGGAVPPNWPCNQWPPGRPTPSRTPFCADSWSSTQAFCLPEHFARDLGLQDSEEFTGQPGSGGCFLWRRCQHSQCSSTP